MNEHSGNSGQLQQPGAVAPLNEPFGDSEQLAPGAGSGGDALVCDLRAAAALGRPLLDSDVDLIEAALASQPDQPPALATGSRQLYQALDRLVRESVHPYDGGEFEDGEWQALDLARAALKNAACGQAEQQGAGDAPIDVTDPWRGLYRTEHLRADEDGGMSHPDLPSWPDDREEGLDKLVHAQGFDFKVVDGEFSDEAVEDGGDLYWQEMRAWAPEVPAGEWRLAWKGDTEDGPCAWFVRPMALRPEPEAITAPPAQADRMAIKMLVAAGFVSEEKANESLRIAHGFGGDLGQPAPVAVPVDGLRDAERIDAIAREYWRLDPIEIPTGAGDADVGWRVSQFLMPNRIQFVAEVFVDDPRQAIDAAMLATHPQPAAAGGDA